MAINKSSPWNDLQEKKNPTQTVRNSPWNNAVQTGNQEVTVQKRKLPEAPVKQGVDLTSLPGAAIGTGIAQTLSGASNLVKSVPVVAKAGARAISNLAKAPVSPMTSKLNAKEVEPNDDNVVQKLANALFKQEQEKTTVELPQTEQEITKNQFQNIANKEMIAQGQTPVKQITDWTNPWDKVLAQNVENVQNAGQTYSRVVTPATDWLDNASQKVTDYTEREFMANLNPTEQFVAQAAGNAIPNFARNALLATVSGGSSAVLGLLSDAFMFAPSFYQGYEEGLAKGLSEEEAMLNATLRGVTEAGTEHLSDVWKVNGGQSKMDEWMLEKIAKSNLNPWAKFMGKGLASGIGESMEEVASRIGNTFADRAFYGNKIDAGQLALGSLEDAGASFISTMVMGLLGGEFSGTSRRQWNAYVDQMQNESAADVLNEAKDHKVELALTYASMSPNEAYDFVSKAQDIIRQKYGNDNEIANMDTWELVGKLDQEAVQIYDNLDDQLRQKYIDRMTNKELPLTQTTLPDGSTYNVYEYLGTRTTDQERALDMARRMGKDILFADELPMGQNALTLGDGTIIISSKAKRPATALAFHEIFHALKSDGQWNDLMDLAYNYMANEKGFSNFVEDLVSRYVSYYGNLDNNYLNSITASKELTDEQKRQEVKDYLREQGVNQYYADPNFHNMIDEEIAADFMERLNNEDSIKAMYNRSGDLFDRTWQNLKDAVKNFAGTLTKDEQNLKKTEQLFAKVAQDEAERLSNPESTSYSLNSYGEPLSVGQEKYFRNSKVRDENGNLVPVYHGTDADFNIFNFDRGGEHGSAEGFGIYLAENPEVSKSYGDNVMQLYANITRPATSEERTLTDSEVIKLIRATAEEEARQLVEDGEYANEAEAIRDTWISNYDYTYDKPLFDVYQNVADKITRFNGNDMDIVQEVMAGMGVRDYAKAMRFYDVLKRVTGIDGFRTVWDNGGNIWLALDSNQLKRTDNLDPTASDDTRFSLSDDELDRQYFDALNRGDTEEAQRLLEERANERGYTDRAYHGTQDFGFTVPDTQYSDDNLSFFATDDVDTAQTYTGNRYVRPITDTQLESRANDVRGMLKGLRSLYPEDFPYNSDEMWDVLMDDAMRSYDENNGDLDVVRNWIDNDLRDWREDAFGDNDPEAVIKAEDDIVQALLDITPAVYADDSTNGIYDLRINPEGLLNLDAQGANWNNLLFNPEDLGVDESDPIFDNPYADTRNMAEFAEHYGYPGYKLSNVYDDGGYGERQQNPSTVYDLFYPQSQVKSNDLITYDDEGNIIPPSQRYNPNNPDIRYSLDNEYLTAVEDGNVEEQDRIIEQAARNAGYNSPKVYHGTNTGDFTVFDKNMVGSNYDGWGRSGKGFYFTTDESDAKIWGERGRGSKPTRVIPAYLKMDNALDLYEPAPTPVKEYIHNQFAVPENWDGTFTEDFITKSLYRTIDFLQDERHMDASDVLQSLGYDGVYSPDGVEYVVYHPSQIKSAEPVTYDDDGNIVLPSERFNYESNDIRYSLDVGDNHLYQYNSFMGDDIRPFIDGMMDSPQEGDDVNEWLTNNETQVKKNLKKLVDKSFRDIEKINLKNVKGSKAKIVNALYEAGRGGRELDIHTLRTILEQNPVTATQEMYPGESTARRRVNAASAFTEALMKNLGFDGFYDSEHDRVMARDSVGSPKAVSLEDYRDMVERGENLEERTQRIDREDANQEYTDEDIQRQIIEDSMNLNSEAPQQREDTVNALAEAMQNEPVTEDIPEQANTFADRNIPQNRSAMNFLGKMSRERNGADSLTYESISPESFPVPDRIQDYIDLINDEEDRKYGFDAPIENELTDEDKDFYQGLVANKTGALQGFATPTQTFNAIAKGEQREELRDRFERPMYETKKEYNANREQRWNALENMIKETGIQANTPESAAVQWYGEGVKPNEQGETIPYTLDDLKREFPNKWQDIQKMERFMRQMYDEYVGRINAALEQVYPNLEEKAQAQLQSWRNKKMLYQDEISMSRNPSANEYWQNEINKLDAKIAKLEGDLESGEYFRNKRLNPRKDYFHHFQEVETSGLGGLKNILQASTLIDPELVGKSEFTKPKSKWMAWLQKRGEGAYTADAVLGMGKYIDSAEYAIAFDPLIAQYRDEISKMVKATRETKNANQLIQYLSAYTNQLAGKTASLDRTILDLLGEGNRGQLFNVLAAINNRAKSNAVVGNVRSAVAQIFNIPNALGIIKSNNAWLKGANDYINAKLGNRELLDQSPFLQERYFSHNVDDLKARNTNWEKIIGKAGDITNKMMEFGDREATELIWLAAYNEGLEKNVSDPIYYADDLTRRSVAGRGIGEVPYNMKSKVASFFMPFQVETNNAWQELKQNLRDKDANGIFRLMLGSYILNGFAKLLFNDGVVPDVLGALIDGIGKLFDKDREESVGEVALNTGKRMAGEAVSYIPGTSLWLPAIMSDESAEALFGDSDPTRYGTGTVGLSTITKTLADAVDGGDFDIVTPLLQMGLPYGGRQASRLYNTLQDFNVLPSNGVMNTPFGGEKNPVAGDYTQAGALKYRLPEEVNSAADVAEIARALAFGSNSTNAASEYYDTLKPVLSKERVAKLREHPEVNPDTYIDYLNEASTDGKQGITQQEAYDWISSHNLSDEEANALWEMTSSSWKKSYDEYQPKEETPTETPKEEKKEEKQNTQKSGKPTTKKEFTDAADANNSGRLSQAEAYDWLNSQKLSDAEKEALWNLMGWKTDYATYASKH